MELKDKFLKAYFEKMYNSIESRKDNLRVVYKEHLIKCNDAVCNGVFVDIGCGRGEMMSLFEELFPGIICTGVDNSDIFSSSISKYSDFEHLDGLEYLDSTFHNIKGITCINVIEYMKPDYLIRFLDSCYTRLEYNGILALETSNIYFPNFVKLYPIYFITSLLEFVGFRDVNIIHSTDNSYSLIATK